MSYVTLDEQGFATGDGLIKYYSTDIENIFLSEVEDFISMGTGLPARGYIDPPPVNKDGYAIVRVNSTWQYIEDHRGQVIYDIETGIGSVVTAIGPLPEGFTTEKPEPDKIEEYTSELTNLVSIYSQDVAILSASYARAALIDGPNEQSKKLEIYTEYQQRKQRHTSDIQLLKLKYEV